MFRYFKKPSQNKRFVCKHSLLLRPAIKVCKQKIPQRAWSGANMHTKIYNLVRLCVRWSPHAERNISDKYLLSDACHGRIQRGDRGPDPLKKSQKYRVSSQYWSGSSKHHKDTKPAFNGGPLSTMTFCWWADGGPFLVAFRPSLTTPSDKMFWIRTCIQCVWTGSIEIKLSTDIIHARIQKALSAGIQLWQRLFLKLMRGGRI